VVQAVLQTASVPETVVQEIVTQAAGNPFFLEELAWHVIEHGGGPPAPLPVPETIEAVLAARIDRLPPEEKRLLQTAAVIGMAVSVPLLQAVTDLAAAELHTHLGHLQTAEFLYETGRLPAAAYTFKHALTHEVAYGSLLQEQQRVLHGRAAQAIEALFAERLPEHYYALALAQQLAHPVSLTMALYWAAVVHHLRREAPLTQARAEAAITMATDQGFPQYLAQAMPLRGWALAASIPGEEGITQIHQGLAAYRATGATANRPYYLSLLAEASTKVAQTAEGLEALAEALATVAKSRVRWWEAELCRLRGELLLQPTVTQPGEAEGCFQQALAVARR
jgi:predicted ATPase